MNRWTKMLAAFVSATICAGGLAAVAGAMPGDVDQAFGINGKVVTVPDAPRDTVLRDLIEVPSGKLLAVGGGVTEDNGVLIRYFRDGSLDRTFGNDGVVLTPMSLWARAAIQADGSIITFGRIGDEPAIARFDESGTRDSSFGDGGSYIAGGIRSQFNEPAKTMEWPPRSPTIASTLKVQAPASTCR